MQERTETLAIWQTEPCPSWCLGGHSDTQIPDDRDHVSDSNPVALSMHRAAAIDEDPFGSGELRELEPYLRQHWMAGETWLEIAMSPELVKDYTLRLRLSEAVELAAAVTGLVAEAGR